MPIPFIQLPFARIRVVDDNHRVNTFSELPNLAVYWQPSEGPDVIIRRGVPTYEKKKILMQLDRLYRIFETRDKNKLNAYLTDIVESIKGVTESRHWIQEYGPGFLDTHRLRMDLGGQSPSNRIGVYLARPPGERKIVRNYLHLHLDRTAEFTTRPSSLDPRPASTKAPLIRNTEAFPVRGSVQLFGEEVGFCVSHPLVDLRTYFTDEQIERRILAGVDESFAWMREKDLFSQIQFDKPEDLSQPPMPTPL